MWCSLVSACTVAQSCLALCDHMDCWPTRLFCLWNSPGKNTGVGSHSFLPGSSPPRDWTHVSCDFWFGRQIHYYWATRKRWGGLSGWSQFLFPSELGAGGQRLEKGGGTPLPSYLPSPHKNLIQRKTVCFIHRCSLQTRPLSLLPSISNLLLLLLEILELLQSEHPRTALIKTT